MLLIRHYLRNLILALCLACVIGRVLHAKKTKVKERKNKQWLVDSIYYDSEYQSDAPAGSEATDLCPPVPDVTSDEACWVDTCRSDTDCSESYRCCFNGCVFTCLIEVKPAAVVDWRKEPRRSRSGISWLVEGPKLSVPDAEPCNTSPVGPDEDPLLCPYGYVCHVDESRGHKKRRKNSGQGYCIKQTTDLVLSEGVPPAEASALRQGNVCTVENIVLLDGAKMRFEDKIWVEQVSLVVQILTSMKSLLTDSYLQKPACIRAFLYLRDEPVRAVYILYERTQKVFFIV